MIYMKNMKKDLSIKQIYDDFILKVTLDEDERNKYMNISNTLMEMFYTEVQSMKI